MDCHIRQPETSTIKRFFQKNPSFLKRKTKFIETDDAKELVNKIFIEFSYKIQIKSHSKSSSKGPVFSQRSITTFRKLPKKPVFEKGNGNFIDGLKEITKNYTNRKHSSTKLKPRRRIFKKERGLS